MRYVRPRHAHRLDPQILDKCRVTNVRLGVIACWTLILINYSQEEFVDSNLKLIVI